MTGLCAGVGAGTKGPTGCHPTEFSHWPDPPEARVGGKVMPSVEVLPPGGLRRVVEGGLEAGSVGQTPGGSRGPLFTEPSYTHPALSAFCMLWPPPALSWTRDGGGAGVGRPRLGQAEG